MKYLIFILFPLFINAQTTTYNVRLVENIFGGTDTISEMSIFVKQIGLPKSDTTLSVVDSTYFKTNFNKNTKSAEIIATQSGTSDPSYLTVHSEIGTIDFTYDAVGTYLLEDRINSFSNDKTFVFIQNRNGSNNYTIDYEYVDSNTIRIYTKSVGTLTNGILNKCFIKIVNYK